MTLKWNHEEIVGWRFKQPRLSNVDPILGLTFFVSFGIEPYRIDPKTSREVKAGAAIVRIGYTNCSPKDHQRAGAIADEITMRLNLGEEYVGPKTITANAKKPMPSISAWFL